jgi:hypothetical protein
MENLTLKDLKLILTNYKKDNIPPSITNLKKDDLIKLINKHDMLNTLNINDVNDLIKLYKPKKERKPRKPKLTPEQEAQAQQARLKMMQETKKWMEEQRKLRK